MKNKEGSWVGAQQSKIALAVVNKWLSKLAVKTQSSIDNQDRIELVHAVTQALVASADKGHKT